MTTIKRTILFLFLFTLSIIHAQDKKTIDGVIAVVGKHIILESDIDKVFLEAQFNKNQTPEITRCNVLGSLLESRMFAHHAVQDSLTISKDEIESIVNNQIDRMVEQKGSLDEVVRFYGKNDAAELREGLTEIITTNRLASMKQNDIVSKIEITPSEVRTFYKSMPEDQLPMVEDMYELSEISIAPKIEPEEEQKVIDKLNDIKKNVESGYSFASQATLYTEDQGSIQTGGLYTIDKSTPFVKEFKDVAFSLKEGEISAPFKTDFGYHIIYLEKIKGSKLDVRHILLSPKPTEAAVEEAQKEIQKIRTRILNKEITFADAARMYSDSKETRASGGIIAFSAEGETRLPVSSLIQDSELYYAVNHLEPHEISQPFISQNNPSRKKVFKIVELTNKIPSHKANFEDDYMEIKELALLEKQRKAVQKWINSKVFDTYIYISDKYKDCEFSSNWLKK